MRWILDARTVNNHFPGIGRYTFNLARAMQPLLADDEELILLRDPRQETVWQLGELVDQNVKLLDVSISPFEFDSSANCLAAFVIGRLIFITVPIIFSHIDPAYPPWSRCTI
jgi:hypothetical protein